MTYPIKVTLTTVLLLALTSCAPFNPQDALAQRGHHLRRQGQTQGYIDGYMDGCSTGKADALNPHYHARQNIIRFKEEHQYHVGYLSGRRVCQQEELNLTPPKNTGLF